jgi:DNA repair exonuclease SbcCD ATPase subunit
MEKNFVNILHSFRILISIIKTQGIDISLLVIAGDIFESKSYLSTDDIFHWKAICKILKTERIKTLVMCGNHDYNINSELARDNVSLITIDCENILCTNKTEIIGGEIFGDPRLEFYIFSPIDKLIPTVLNNDCIKIAMLHEPINYAIYDNGESISDGRFSAADLAQYDYALLGDIHLTQFLTDRIAYCGSFVQKTKGEGINKGYILWDLETGVGKFNQILLKEIYITIEAFKNQCELPVIDKSQIIRHTTLIYTDCTPEYIADLKKTITNRYNYINRIVDKTKLKAPTAQPIDKDSSMQSCEEIIKIILEDNPNTDKILTHHTNIMRNRNPINFTTYKLNYLCFSNVFCYGEDNYIDFSNFSNDLVMLNGKNKEGKSSIIDIIIRILFNECERGFKEDIVNKSKNKGYIKICFNIANDVYIIEQVFNRSAKSQQHRLYKNGENISCDTMINTYKFLRDTIGLGDYKDFVNMTTALQNRNFLVDMQQKDFISLLTKITNIDILKDIEDETKKKITGLRSISRKLTDDISRIPEIKLEEIITLQTQLTQLEKSRDDAYTHINQLHEKLILVNRDYNDIPIPSDLELQIENVSNILAKFGDFKTSLTIEDIQKKQWVLNKVVNSVSHMELKKIMSNDYSLLKTLDRMSIVKQIKELTDITYKPRNNSIRDVRTLQCIIDNPCMDVIQPLERCEIDAPIVLDPNHMDEALVQSGLPDYERIKQEFNEINAKLKQHSNNYGQLSFDTDCISCVGNKTCINKIFDTNIWVKKLSDLKSIYDQRKSNRIKLENAIAYKKNILQNEIFAKNQIIKSQNDLIATRLQEYNMAVMEMREANNKQNWSILQGLKQQLKIFEEADIQSAEIERRDLDAVYTYLTKLQEYKSLQALAQIKINNGNSITTIKKLNELTEISNKKLHDANASLSLINEEYRIKRSQYDKRLELIQSHSENNAELEFNELYFKVVNCKTGLPSYILKETCTKIQNNCNKILQKIADFTIYIEYSKDIKIYTVENDIKIPATMGSGMQKFILDLVFRITLTQISTISNPNMIFIDEGFGALDKENFVLVAGILKKLKLNFDALIIISHLSEMKSYMDKSIDITRNKYLSNVQYGDLTNDQKTIHLLDMNAKDDKRNNDFKDNVKKSKIESKQIEKNKENADIAKYCNAHGGMSKVMFLVQDDKIFCRGCQKNFANKSGFIEKHLNAATVQSKHRKYLLTLI